MLLGSNGAPPLATRPHDSIDTLRGLENINISALFDPDSSAALSGLAPAWSLSRQARNRLQHALHGNGPPKQRQQPSAISLDQRQLQELLEARTLRAAGWQLPSAIAGNSLVRVYDTRIPKEWVRALAADVQRVDDPDQVVVVGGDFASDTDVTDVDALAHARPAPWASRPAHILIPPRALRGMGGEAAGAGRFGEPGDGVLPGCSGRKGQMPARPGRGCHSPRAACGGTAVRR